MNAPEVGRRIVLVTGATGMIGGKLAELLIGGGHDVRALVRPGSGAAELERIGVRVVTGDVLGADSLDRAMSGCQDVYHCAALVPGTSASERDFMRVNREGTDNVLAAVVRAGVTRFLHVSTVTVLGAAQGCTIDEAANDPIDIHPGYDRSKFDAEVSVRRYSEDGLHAVIVNPATAYGPGSRYSGRIISAFLRGRMPVLPLPERQLSLVYVGDCARGAIAALERGVSGQRYILAAPAITIREFVRTLAEVSGRRVPRIIAPEWFVVAGLWTAWAISPVTRWKPPVTVKGVTGGGTIYNGQKAYEELGLRYTSVHESLRETVEWFQTRG